MGPTALVLSLLLQSSTPAATSVPSPAPDETVILFLIDNSASLPPLDPDEKRVEALEKMFTFLQGQRYRLVLFGGRREVFVDDVSRYRNNGQWTDFYFAFAKAQELTKGYPSGTRFRIIFLTDAVADPGPEDWADMGIPPGEDLKAYTNRKTLELVGQMQIPVYVILVGTPPVDGVEPQNKEQAPGFILDIVRAANGRAASPLAQTLASFFEDDGLLLRKFVYRVAPNEGLKTVEPIVRRIAAAPDSKIERRIVLYLVLPLDSLPLRASWPARTIFPGARRPRNRRARNRCSRAPHHRSPPQAREWRLLPHWPLPDGGRPRSAGEPHLPASPPGPLRLGTRHLFGRPDDFVPAAPGSRRPQTLSRGVLGRRNQGREDLGPEPRLHGEEPHRTRGRADPWRHRLRPPSHRGHRLPPGQGPHPR